MLCRMNSSTRIAPDAARAARDFGCTEEQAKRLMARNADGLQQMADKAKRTGNKVSGYTEADLSSSAREYSIAASDFTCGLKGSSERFPVSSLSDAVLKFSKVSDCFTGSEMPQGIIYRRGVKFAYISYNGRVWDLARQEIRVGHRKTAAEHEADGWRDYRS
jgi:hypothetical protein